MRRGEPIEGNVLVLDLKAVWSKTSVGMSTDAELQDMLIDLSSSFLNLSLRLRFLCSSAYFSIFLALTTSLSAMSPYVCI